MNGYETQDWDVQLATQLMLEAIRAAINEIDDEEEVPLGRILIALGEQLNVETNQVDPELHCTVVELRRRIRLGIEDLAAKGDTVDSG